MKAKTILIADDELHYVNPLRSALEKEGYSVMWAQNAAETISKAAAKPEILIMDLMRGQSAGFDVCRKLRSMPEAKHLPIIMLTNRNEEADEVIGLELGADEYLHKSVSPRVLSARIKNVLRRYNVRTQEEVSCLKIAQMEIDKNSHCVMLAGKEIFLPRKEFELLWILASNRGKVFSREMLLRRIWGENIYVTDRTVDVHICKVRERLNKFGQENIETIKGVGYRFKT
ncbi:MAG: response regulator transcription factor [Rhizobacter sp.]|nr:response regulator transcription factor [Chlorobiales bacterium]